MSGSGDIVRMLVGVPMFVFTWMWESVMIEQVQSYVNLVTAQYGCSALSVNVVNILKLMWYGLLFIIVGGPTITLIRDAFSRKGEV